MAREDTPGNSVLKEFVRRVKEKHGDRVEDVILFGSHARGDCTDESDIDVLIVIDREDFKLRRDITGIAYDLLLETTRYISPKVISLEDYTFLQDINTSFIRNINEEGIAIE